MGTQLTRFFKTHRATPFMGALLLALIILPFQASATAQSQSRQFKAQPILLEMATQQPGTMVGVIVQKQVNDKSVENLVAGRAVRSQLTGISSTPSPPGFLPKLFPNWRKQLVYVGFRSMHPSSRPGEATKP